jgi:uncharacterized phage protein (TIGR02218 family)
MPRTLTAAVTTEKNKSLNRPVELFQIYLDQETLYFANHPVNIHFYNEDGVATIYYALGLSRSPVKTNINSRVDEVTVSLDNVNLEMSALIGHTEFVGRRMVIWKILRLEPTATDEDLEAGSIVGGVRTSPVYNLAGICEDSKISWVPVVGQTPKVETRISYDGATWQDWKEVISGQSIPGMYLGLNMTTQNSKLQIRQTPVTAIVSSYFVIGALGEAYCTADDYAIIFDGTMDEPVITEYSAKVTVLSQLDYLGKQIPRRLYARPCQVKFGSVSCGVALGEVTGTISAFSADLKTLTLSGRTEAADYYKDGVLTVGFEYRRVMSSNGASIVIDYAFNDAIVGNTYNLRRGCDKTFETCDTRFNNELNFRGFRSVSNEARIFR